jgi:hypothetical protein
VKHCDDYINDSGTPECLRWFLLINRLPAVASALCYARGVRPVLFATLDGKRVRVVMASRLGDVGITDELERDHGYQQRTWIELLSNFSEVP